MTIIKTSAAVIILLTLGACATMGKVSATDCFTAGGTIDSSGEKSMCTMQDGSTKQIL